MQTSIQQRTPAQKLKYKIRRQHRQKIRKQIMNKFHNFQQLEARIWELYQLIKFQIQDQYWRWVKNKENGQKGQREQKEEKGENQGKGEEEFGDFWEIGRLVEDVYWLLDSVQSYSLEQLLNFQSQTNPNPQKPPLQTQLQNLIKYYIPSYLSKIDQIKSAKNAKNRQKYEKLFTNLMEILCQLSAVRSLSDCYFYWGDGGQQCCSDEVQKFMSREVEGYEGFRVLGQVLMTRLVMADSLFYKAMISMGNILHQQTIKQWQPPCQISQIHQTLCDISIQNILTCLLSKLLSNFLHPSSQQPIPSSIPCPQSCQSPSPSPSPSSSPSPSPQSQSQQILIWFINIYVKYLFLHEFPLFSNTLLSHKLDIYLYRKLAYFRDLLQQGNWGKGDVDIFRYLISILDKCQVRLDNFIIVNTLLPLIRGNLQMPEIAKLWLYLSFNRDYDLVELINVHYQQDKKTVKNLPTNEANSCHPPKQLTFRSPSQISTLQNIETLFTQILETIAQSSPYISSKRNKDFLRGMYNILLEMREEDAIFLWKRVFHDNDALQNKIMLIEEGERERERVKGSIWDVIEKIQQFLTRCQSQQQ